MDNGCGAWFSRDRHCGENWPPTGDDCDSAGLRSMVAIASMLRNARFEGDAQGEFGGGERSEGRAARGCHQSLSSHLFEAVSVWSMNVCVPPAAEL